MEFRERGAGKEGAGHLGDPRESLGIHFLLSEPSTGSNGRHYLLIGLGTSI
jgi:hypothetical protein